ncbi:unnamed protein product [Hapterophycus canaliculatus]
MVSKAGEGVGRADNDRQFLYLNGRPVDLPKFTRAISEVWRTYEMKQKPAFILDLRLPPGTFDVNVTPDKREIFMTGEAAVLDKLKTALHRLWESSRYTIPVNQGQLVQARLTDGAFILRDTQANSPPAPASLENASSVGVVSPGDLVDPVVADQDEIWSASGTSDKDQSMNGKESSGARETEALREGRNGVTMAQESTGRAQRERRSKGAEDRYRGGRDADGPKVPERSLDPAKSSSGNARRSVSPSNQISRRAGGEGVVKDAANDPEATRVNVEANGDHGVDERQRKSHKGVERHDKGRLGTHGYTRRPQGGQRDPDDEDFKKDNPNTGGGDTSSSAKRAGGTARGRTAAGGLHCAPLHCAPLSYDMKSVLRGCRTASRLKRKRDARNASAHSFSTNLSGCGANNQDSKAAARAFSRVLDKEHFTQMRVVGQFNLGFMICLLGSDLFILDQHACDEKYNFEVLQETTTIHQQPLVRPLPLETSASEEMTIIDNITLFERNGFRFMIDDNQPTTRKLKITAIPFSKGTQFGVDDVHELASIVADNSSPGEMVRLPKARAMFASRACRSSIMIGKALDKGQMARVVAKMATIEQPWNCPHGRPTMRHLADVSASLRSAAGLEPLLEA